MALTRRQKQVLDFISGFIEQNGYSPSYQEIAQGLGLASLATVHKHISALDGKHYLKRGFNQSRSLEVTSKQAQEQRRLRADAELPLEVPLLGWIPAGNPAEAGPRKESLNLAPLLGSESLFALEVKGDSMVEDHILSGDYVLVERTTEVRDGEIVVALVSGAEATLKRFYRQEDGMVRLQPANAAMAPIVAALPEIEIQGRVLAVLRKYT